METRKLTLSKETLRTLDDAELTDVVGGQPTNGVVCVNTVICQSGVCHNDTVICNSAVLCQSGVCNSAVCNSGAICNSVFC